MIGHVEFNGPTSEMKLWFREKNSEAPQLRHTLIAHDVGVNDGTLPDQYGTKCKCPPGNFSLGFPQGCAIRLPTSGVSVRNDDDRAYGCFFTPIYDTDPNGPLKQHGRAGLGIHGGGSDLPDPFALYQGWEWTFGCIRLQNIDNEMIFAPFVKYILQNGGKVALTVAWGTSR